MNGDLLDFAEAEDLGFGGFGESYDDYESEDDGGYGEDYFGEDGYYQESAEAPRDYRNQAALRARAAARARALALARRGVPVTRPRRPTYFPATSKAPASTPQVRQGFSRVAQDIQKTQAAVQTVNLDNKVQTDSFGKALRTQRDRIGRNEYALTATRVVDELKDRFPDLFQNEVLRTVIPLAPLLFLKPHKRGSGVESFLADPRVWGPLLVGGIALFNETRGNEPQEVVITPAMFTLTAPATGGVGSTVPLLATVRDRSGRILSVQPAVTFASSDTSKATVDPGTGMVTAVAPGTVLITATVVGTSIRNTATITVIKP